MSEDSNTNVWSPDVVGFDGRRGTVDAENLLRVAARLEEEVPAIRRVRAYGPTNPRRARRASFSLRFDRDNHPRNGTFWESEDGFRARRIMEEEGFRRIQPVARLRRQGLRRR